MRSWPRLGSVSAAKSRRQGVYLVLPPSATSGQREGRAIKARWTSEQLLSTLRRPVMPVTVGFVQGRTGMAEHAARRARNDLVRRGALVPVGRYQWKKHGFWVTLYRVIQPRASVTASVRRTRVVKTPERKQWWRHALFGTPDGFGPHRYALAEIKLVGHRFDDWKTGPPEYVHLQVQAQMACYPKAQRVHVAP